MVSLPSELVSWADFFAKMGQFVFGLCALALTLWAAMTKRKDVFRSELSKRQLEEVGKIRTDLHSICFDIYYIPITTQTMRTMSWNLDQLKENDPDAWEQVQRYKKTSLDLFYKFSSKNYYLFPSWLDRKKIDTFANAMNSFAPFTLHATSSRTDEELKNYENLILELKDHFDDALRKNI